MYTIQCSFSFIYIAELLTVTDYSLMLNSMIDSLSFNSLQFEHQSVLCRQDLTSLSECDHCMRVCI